MLQKLKSAYDHFNQVLAEGHYHEKKPSLWSMITGKNSAPDAPNLMAFNKMFNMSSSYLGNRLLWTPVIAILSVNLQLYAAVGLCILAAGALGFEYMRCQRARKEIMTEVNFAGQTVTGTRADLARLHQAQMSVMSLSTAFRPATYESAGDTIRDIVASVAAERKRVTIVDRGTNGAKTDVYDFSRPRLSLISDGSDPFAPLQRAAAFVTCLEEAVPALEKTLEKNRLAPAASNAFTNKAKPPAALRKSFARRRYEETQILTQLVAMENTLSPTMKRKFRQALAKAG
jgi:hypothetical protein